MNKRKFLTAIVTLASAPLLSKKVLGATMGTPTKIVKIHKAAAEWKQLLPADRFYILREEGTERASTSPLNKEKGKGIYVCAGCDLPLFTST